MFVRLSGLASHHILRQSSSRSSFSRRAWGLRQQVHHDAPIKVPIENATSDGRAQSATSGILARYAEELLFPPATHEIRHLEDSPTPAHVVVHGYLGPRHDLSKKLSFVPIYSKGLDHVVQVIANASASPAASKALQQLKECRAHTPVVVCGELKIRKDPATKDWDQMRFCKTMEIDIRELHPLNDFPADLNIDPGTRLGPEQRHLQIRQDKSLRDALQFRSDVARRSRDFLHDKHFIEYETPLLFKSTPEGAREFLVPTRTKGMAYALPQSPQQFKQILMSSGVARYFQIARCFRDEDHRADRQPEFTQLDLEMSFSTGQDVMACVEELVKHLWELTSQEPLPQGPFPQLTYHSAMSHFGSDKPDLRRNLRIHRVDHVLPADMAQKMTSLKEPAIDCLHVKCGEVLEDARQTWKLVRDFLDSTDGAAYGSNPEGAPGVFVADSTKPLRGLSALGFEAAEKLEKLWDLVEGDLLVMQARRDMPLTGGSTTLGRMGLEIHKLAVAKGLARMDTATRPLWVTNFPLFSPIGESDSGQGGSAGLTSTHHPFTSPKTPEDVHLLASEPGKVIGDHYDLVINGVELGGGSRRIHSAEMQAYVLRDVLKMSKRRLAEFAHLLEVLRAGCPPHAGIALGLDRLVAVMLGKESVRDVIAFPKSGSGEDPLVKSPGHVSWRRLRTYHLRMIDPRSLRPGQTHCSN